MNFAAMQIIGFNSESWKNVIDLLTTELLCVGPDSVTNAKLLYLGLDSFSGEYSNAEFEELIEWINATIPVDASFAGDLLYNYNDVERLIYRRHQTVFNYNIRQTLIPQVRCR